MKLGIALIFVVFARCDENTVFTVIGNVCITNSTSAISFIEPLQNERNFFAYKDQLKFIEIKNMGSWKLEDSITGTLKGKIITDYRWQEFITYVTEHNKHQLNYQNLIEVSSSGFNIALSIRAQYESHIFLCDGPYPPDQNCYWILIGGFKGSATVIRQCSINEIGKRIHSYPKPPCSNWLASVNHSTSEYILNENVWQHFKIQLVENELRLFNSERGIIKYYFKKPFEVTNFIIHSKYLPALWKLHDYKYFFTEEAIRSTIENIDIQNGRNCFSLFVIMCNTCSLFFRFIYNEEIFIKKVKFENYEWREVKFIFSSNSDANGLIIIYPENSVGYPGFWAISNNMQNCALNEYRKIEKEYGYFSCQMISNGKTINETDYETVGSLTGEQCNDTMFGSNCLPCSLINGCDQKKYCEEINGVTKCSCSYGYFLKNGSCEECVRGKYGFGCEQQCTNCARTQCNHKGICSTRCRNSYEGKRCDITKLSILKYPPNIIKEDKTSCSVVVSNFEIIGKTKPKFYKIQYTQVDKQQWIGVGEIYQFNSSKSLEIIGLEADTEYYIRAVLLEEYDFNYDYPENIPKTVCHTLCNSLTESQVNVVTTNNSATIRFQTVDEACKIQNYVYCFNGTLCKKLKTNLYLIDLDPYTQYEIKFISTYWSYNLTKTFKTKEGVPGEIQNLTFSTTNGSIDLKWTEPKNKNGEILNYEIRYQYLGKKCDSGNTVTDTSVNLISRDTEKIIDNLIPYSCYKILIRAVTKEFNGNATSIMICTQSNDAVSLDEIPTTNSSKSILHFLWECNRQNGPLVAYITFFCKNEWCNKLEQNFTIQNYEKNITINYQHPFSNYTINIYFCRSLFSSNNCQNISKSFISKSTAPNSVQDLQFVSITKKYIALRWLPPYPPTGKLKKYRIKVYRFVSYPYYEIDVNINSCKIWINYHCANVSNDVHIGYDYLIAVLAYNEDIEVPSKPAYISNIFVENIEPSSPNNLMVSENNENKIKFSWLHPNQTNGNLRQFQLTIGTEGMKQEVEVTYNFSYILKSEEDYNLTYFHEIYNNNSLSCRTKTIKIVAFNEYGHSKPLKIIHQFPPIIPEIFEIIKPSINTISINLTGQYISRIHLFISIYAVETVNTEWKEVNAWLNESIFDKNDLITYEKELEQLPFNFVIGDDKIISSVLNPTYNISNSVLKSDTLHVIKMLLVYKCNSINKFGYKLKTFNITTLEQNTSKNVFTTVAVVLPALIVFILGIIICHKLRNGVFDCKFINGGFCSNTNNSSSPPEPIVLSVTDHSTRFLLNDWNIYVRFMKPRRSSNPIVEEPIYAEPTE